MRNDDIFDVAEDILRGINHAAETGNFKNLGRDVRHIVMDVTNEIKGEAFSLFKPHRTPFFSKTINKSAGVLRIVFGCIILFFALIEMLSSAMLIGTAAEIIVFLVTTGILLGAGIPLLISGIRAQVLVDNYGKYGRIAGNREYISISELADKTLQGPEVIIKNIISMKKKGYLPNAALDKQNTTLMLTDAVYEQYLRTLEEERPTQPQAEPQPSSSITPEALKEYYTIEASLPEDVKEILKEGNVYLNKIRYYNDLIPDDQIMSDKLYTLEATVLAIFKKLKEEPVVAGDMRKLMSYYLPTTEKLLQSYVDLREQPDNLSNIKNSQKEIEDATDVINEAFVKLLNQMFQSNAWDISSDISVMKTMMKQDSLL